MQKQIEKYLNKLFKQLKIYFILWTPYYYHDDFFLLPKLFQKT